MTEEKFQEIKEVVRMLVKPPWFWDRCYEMPGGEKHWALTTPESKAKGLVLDGQIVLTGHNDTYLGTPLANKNLQFVANAREYVDLLIEEVERLRADNNAYARR